MSPAAVFAELCDSMGEEVVLHGDLHHENILRSGDGWVAVDPKGGAAQRTVTGMRWIALLA